MDKNKKVLVIGGIIEVAILIFALVLSIIVWTTVINGKEFNGSVEQLKQANIDKNGPFIAFFQNNTTAFFCIVCIPIFVIVALDFVYFAIIASKRETTLSNEQIAAIKKKAEEEVREEMMKELLKEDQKKE